MLQVHFETKGGWLIFCWTSNNLKKDNDLAILCDPSETVKWAFRRLSDLQLYGIKRSQLESPGNGKLVVWVVGALGLESRYFVRIPGVSQNIPENPKHPGPPKIKVSEAHPLCHRTNPESPPSTAPKVALIGSFSFMAVWLGYQLSDLGWEGLEFRNFPQPNWMATMCLWMWMTCNIVVMICILLHMWIWLYRFIDIHT